MVAADILIGSDFVSACGGLRLHYEDDGNLVSVTLGRVAAASEAPIQESQSADENPPQRKMSRHVSVIHDGQVRMLSWNLEVDDGLVRSSHKDQCWIAKCTWEAASALQRKQLVLV